MSNLKSNFDPPYLTVKRAVLNALREDLEPIGDITSALVDPDKNSMLELNSRLPGVLAGKLCFLETFNQIDSDIKVDFYLEDGALLDVNTKVALIEGNFGNILTAERTALNFLSHLSGIATLTYSFVLQAKKGSDKVKILDTRKTTPGLRTLEKAAVRAGRGFNHRGNLSEAILIKDNHLGGLSIEQAIETAKNNWPLKTVEVECDKLDQVIAAAKAGATVVMLDNMDIDEITFAVKQVEEINREFNNRTLVEVSGGVTLNKVTELAQAGPDFISVGAITNSAPVLDFGIDLV
jgi:nicotinate-nucleotide pyrophosphorylase (carboxylating)